MDACRHNHLESISNFNAFKIYKQDPQVVQRSETERTCAEGIFLHGRFFFGEVALFLCHDIRQWVHANRACTFVLIPPKLCVYLSRKHNRDITRSATFVFFFFSMVSSRIFIRNHDIIGLEKADC